MGGRPSSAVSAKRKAEAARGAVFLDDFLNERQRPHVDEPLASSSTSAAPEVLASRPPELSPSTPASSSSRAHFDEGAVAEVIWPQPDSPMSAEGASLTELSPAASEPAVAAESEEAGSGEAAASQTAVNVGQCMKDHGSMCALIDWIINMKCENVKNASDLAKRIGKITPRLSTYRNGQRGRLELTQMRAFLMRSFLRIGLPNSIPADAASLGGSGADPARAAACVQPIPPALNGNRPILEVDLSAEGSH